MDIILVLPIVISAVLTALMLPYWIKKCRIAGLLWEDMNKRGKPRNVASSGGIIVVIAFVLGILSYVAIKTFVLNITNDAIAGIFLKLFALMAVVLIIAIIGLVDDLLGWKHGGLSKRFRIFLALVASIPLIVINAGEHVVSLPFAGTIDLGILYPLIIIPIGIAGATTTYNFLAGFNGLEAGQGIIMLGFLSFIAYSTGSSWLALVGLSMVASLIVFYIYNRFPAKVFPGGILTYSTGALIAGMAILGNFEKIAIFVFIPYIIEVILKLRGGLKKHSFAKPNKDNSLELPYKKFYSLNHIAIAMLKRIKQSHKVYERDVGYFVHAVQIIIIILAIIIFRRSIFI